MKPPLVTISVPVYNSGIYLYQCLESLIHQTLKDIEIILVDDGSTDESGSICDEYAKKDPRILVIHQVNGGSASARQTALENAHGMYFGACDSDDWIELNMYEQLYGKAVETGADIVMCDFLYEYVGKKVVPVKYKSYRQTDNRQLVDDALSGKFPCSFCNKLIKREVFTKRNLSWEKGVNLGEDFLMMLKILQYNTNIAFIPHELYHYRRILGGPSYTNHITLSSFYQSLYIRNWVSENYNESHYRKAIFQLWIGLAFTGLRVNDGMTKSLYNETILSRLPIIKLILMGEFSLKHILVLSTKIFGYRFGKFLYNKLYFYFYH